MKSKQILVFLFGLLIAGFLAITSRQMAFAKTCYDAKKQPIPCPSSDDSKKKKTEVPPSSTAIPSPTSTPVPTLIITSTATKIFVQTNTSGGNSQPNQAGFDCSPYAGSLPVGVGTLVLGLIVMFQGPGGLSLRSSAERIGPQNSSQAGDHHIPAQYDPNESIFSVMLRMLVAMSAEARENRRIASLERSQSLSAQERRIQQDNNDALEAGMAEAEEKYENARGSSTANLIMRVIGSTARFIGLIGAGIGTGLLGSSIFAGLLGFNCISAGVLLPGGAILGLIGAIVASLFIS